MSQALTTNQLIELVKQTRAKEAKQEKELKPQHQPSKIRNLIQFIREYPNKLFWISSILVACIGIIIIEIFYHLDWTKTTTKQSIGIKLQNPETKIETGTKPVFTVFWIGFAIVCILCYSNHSLLNNNHRDYP